MKRGNIVIFAAVGIIFATVGAYLSARISAHVDVQKIAVDKLWGTSLTDSNGRSQALSQWKGKTLLVNFWATWCAPCVQEMPELSDLQKPAEKKNIQIIGIGVDSNANIKEFLSKRKINYPLYIGETAGGELARAFGNAEGGLPFTVLIDENGHIQKSYVGRLKFDVLRRDLRLP